MSADALPPRRARACWPGLPALTAALAALAPGAARAQAPPARDPAAAEALYQAGRALIAKGDWDAGCPKFEASMELDPAASTSINIARCHEHNGRIASAWAEYKRALVVNAETPGAARQKTLADLASKALAALEPRLPRLRIAIDARPAGLRVLRDGVEMPLGTLGEAIPADPGTATIEASAPGHGTERRTVTLEPGKTAEVTLTLAPEQRPAGTAGAATGEQRPAPGPARSGGGIPTWAWVSGGVGLALAATGVAFRIDGAAAESILDEKCGPERVCDPASGYDPAGENARKNRDFVMFVALGGLGAAAVGAAVIGIVTAPSGEDPAPASGVRAGAWVGPGGFGLSLGGAY